MEGQVPAPPRPAALEPDTEWKLGQPREEGDYLRVEEASACEEPTAAAEAPGTSLQKPPSEDDIIMFGKKVHVHGELAKKEVHPPQHAPTNLNYAAVAKEELHDVAQHPPHINLLGGQTGVEEWDKVNQPNMGRAKDDAKELLVPGAHKAEA